MPNQVRLPSNKPVSISPACRHDRSDWTARKLQDDSEPEEGFSAGAGIYATISSNAA